MHYSGVMLLCGGVGGGGWRGGGGGWCCFFFFFNDTATTEIYTLSLHDALPICEGATCLMEVSVSGTDTAQDARQIARTVAGSSLVKSAVFGHDPNWGRIAGAVGRAGVTLDQAQLTITLGDVVLLHRGQPQTFDPMAAHTYLKQCSELSSQAMPQTSLHSINQANEIVSTDEPASPLKRQAIAAEALAHPVQITVSVGNGSGTGRAWGCDLSYDYVKINAEYTT